MYTLNDMKTQEIQTLLERLFGMNVKIVRECKKSEKHRVLQGKITAFSVDTEKGSARLIAIKLDGLDVETGNMGPRHSGRIITTIEELYTPLNILV